jgi:hypothetical protein
MSHTRTYKTWEMMIQRCNNKNFDSYPFYGGRGIKVCDKWHLFLGFYEDMGERPEGLSLDRIDVNGSYYKENCRWASMSIQVFNTRIRSDNTSGICGVYWHKASNKWTAAIMVDKKPIHLGLHLDIEEAISARKLGEIKYFGFNKEGQHV